MLQSSSPFSSSGPFSDDNPLDSGSVFGSSGVFGDNNVFGEQGGSNNFANFLQSDNPSANFGSIIKQFVGGFGQGFTTISFLEEEADHWAENLAHTVGYFLGFVGIIPGVGTALSGTTKGAVLAGRGISKGIQLLGKGVAGEAGEKIATKAFSEGVRANVNIGKYYTNVKSVPFYISGKVIDKGKKLLDGTKAAEMSSKFLSKKVGMGTVGDIIEGGMNLGMASAISSWQGGVDQMLYSAAWGGFFGTGDRFLSGIKIFKDNFAARALAGSMFNGLPSTAMGQPFEVQVFDYLVGAYFGTEMPYTQRKALEVINTHYKKPEDAYKLMLGIKDLPEYKNAKELYGEHADLIRQELDHQAAMMFGRPGDAMHALGMLDLHSIRDDLAAKLLDNGIANTDQQAYDIATQEVMSHPFAAFALKMNKELAIKYGTDENGVFDATRLEDPDIKLQFAQDYQNYIDEAATKLANKETNENVEGPENVTPIRSEEMEVDDLLNEGLREALDLAEAEGSRTDEDIAAEFESSEDISGLFGKQVDKPVDPPTTDRALGGLPNKKRDPEPQKTQEELDMQAELQDAEAASQDVSTLGMVDKAIVDTVKRDEPFVDPNTELNDLVNKIDDQMNAPEPVAQHAKPNTAVHDSHNQTTVPQPHRVIRPGDNDAVRENKVRALATMNDKSKPMWVRVYSSLYLKRNMRNMDKNIVRDTVDAVLRNVEPPDGELAQAVANELQAIQSYDYRETQLALAQKAAKERTPKPMDKLRDDNGSLAGDMLNDSIVENSQEGRHILEAAEARERSILARAARRLVPKTLDSNAKVAKFEEIMATFNDAFDRFLAVEEGNRDHIGFIDALIDMHNDGLSNDDIKKVRQDLSAIYHKYKRTDRVEQYVYDVTTGEIVQRNKMSGTKDMIEERRAPSFVDRLLTRFFGDGKVHTSMIKLYETSKETTKDGQVNKEYLINENTNIFDGVSGMGELMGVVFKMYRKGKELNGTAKIHMAHLKAHGKLIFYDSLFKTPEEAVDYLQRSFEGTEYETDFIRNRDRFVKEAMEHFAQRGEEVTAQELTEAYNVIVANEIRMFTEIINPGKTLKDLEGKGFVNDFQKLNKRMQLFHAEGYWAYDNAIREQGVKGLTEKGYRTITINSRNKTGVSKRHGVEDSFFNVEGEDGSIQRVTSETETDGVVIVRQDVYDAHVKDAGYDPDSGAMKTVIAGEGTEGALLSKHAMFRATDAQQAWMDANNIHMILHDTATKQLGSRKTYDSVVRDGNLELIDPSTGKEIGVEDTIMELAIDSVAYNLTTRETVADQLKPQGLVKQLFGNLTSSNVDQRVIDQLYDQHVRPVIEGDPENRARLERANKGDAASLATLRVDRLGVMDILDVFINGNKYHPDVYDKVVRHIMNHVKRTDPEDIIKEAEFYEQDLAGASKVFASMGGIRMTHAMMEHPFMKKYFDAKLRGYISDRIGSPEIKYSMKSIGNPSTGWDAPPREGLFRMGKAAKDFVVRSRAFGEDMTLGELWRAYETAKDEKLKAKIEKDLEMIVIRVPSDSVSGSRVLRFDGFSDYNGTGISLHSTDMAYLGGMDLDIDSTFIYQDLGKDPVRTGKEKGLVKLKGKTKYTSKDQAKSDRANAFIGRGSEKSSTAQYAKDWGGLANKGNYSSDDVVFVSVEGNREGRLSFDKAEVDKAISAGVTFVVDGTQDRARDYNVGERELFDYLTEKGYREIEDGVMALAQILNETPAKKKQVPQQEAPSLHSELKRNAYQWEKVVKTKDGKEHRVIKESKNKEGAEFMEVQDVPKADKNIMGMMDPYNQILAGKNAHKGKSAVGYAASARNKIASFWENAPDKISKRSFNAKTKKEQMDRMLDNNPAIKKVLEENGLLEAANRRDVIMSELNSGKKLSDDQRTKLMAELSSLPRFTIEVSFAKRPSLDKFFDMARQALNYAADSSDVFDMIDPKKLSDKLFSLAFSSEASVKITKDRVTKAVLVKDVFVKPYEYSNHKAALDALDYFNYDTRRPLSTVEWMSSFAEPLGTRDMTAKKAGLMSKLTRDGRVSSLFTNKYGQPLSFIKKYEQVTDAFNRFAKIRKDKRPQESEFMQNGKLNETSFKKAKRDYAIREGMDAIFQFERVVDPEHVKEVTAELDRLIRALEFAKHDADGKSDRDVRDLERTVIKQREYLDEIMRQDFSDITSWLILSDHIGAVYDRIDANKISKEAKAKLYAEDRAKMSGVADVAFMFKTRFADISRNVETSEVIGKAQLMEALKEQIGTYRNSLQTPELRHLFDTLMLSSYNRQHKSDIINYKKVKKRVGQQELIDANDLDEAINRARHSYSSNVNSMALYVDAIGYKGIQSYMVAYDNVITYIDRTPNQLNQTSLDALLKQRRIITPDYSRDLEFKEKPPEPPKKGAILTKSEPPSKNIEAQKEYKEIRGFDDDTQRGLLDDC
jgi:hypothetical protein